MDAPNALIDFTNLTPTLEYLFETEKDRISALN